MTKRMMMLIYRLFLHAYLLIYSLIYIPTKETRRSIRDTKWSGQSSVGTRSLAYSLTHLTTYSLTEESVMSTRTYSDLTSRIGLAFGDVISLLSFAAIGRSNHGAHSLTYSLTHLLTHSPTHSGEVLDPIQLLTTAFPFLFTWLTLAPLLGAYSRDATSSRNKVFVGILPAWIVTIPLALCLRGVIKGAVPPTPFIIVSLVSTYVILSAWRYLYVRLNGETSDKGDRQAGVFEIFKMVGTLMRRW